MPANSKKSDKKLKTSTSRTVKNYGDQPYFIKKAEASRKVVEKYGLPPGLTVSK